MSCAGLAGKWGARRRASTWGFNSLPFDTAMSGSGNRGAPLASGYEEPLPEPDTVVRVMSREVMLPLIEQPPLSDAQARVDEAQRRLDDLKERAAPAAEMEAATFATKRANMTLSRAQTYGGREAFPVELHLLQIGPAVLVGTEGEPFAEIGLANQSRVAVARDLVWWLHRRLGRVYPHS